MLVVHGAWVDGRLGVWAEDTARAPLPASRATLRRHPFAAPTATLVAALNGAATREAVPAGPFTGVTARAEDRELTIRLPGSAAGRCPLPNPA